MTGWVSAAEALRLLGEHREDPKGVLIARAADGAGSSAKQMWLGNDKIEAELGREFWEAMQNHSTSQDWSAGEFTCSGYGDLCRTGRDGPAFESGEKLVWRATGVEFYWPDIAEALELGDSPVKSSKTENAYFEAWNTPQRRQGWKIDFKPTESWIRERFKQENPNNPRSLSKAQWRAVQDHFRHLDTRPRGRPKSGTRRAPDTK